LQSTSKAAGVPLAIKSAPWRTTTTNKMSTVKAEDDDDQDVDEFVKRELDRFLQPKTPLRMKARPSRTDALRSLPLHI
jgi:hypothetical protein